MSCAAWGAQKVRPDRRTRIFPLPPPEPDWTAPTGMVESVKLMNEYLELYPTDMDAWRELAELYLEMGHVEAAKTALEECVMLSPINYVSHTLLADALYTLGDFGTARKYYAQSLELNGAATNARAALGMVLCTTAINSKPKATAEEKVTNTLHDRPSFFSPPCGTALGGIGGARVVPRERMAHV